MSGEHRGERCISLLRGLVNAIAVTLVGMAVLALLVVYARLSDNALLSVNQLLKLAAIFVGTWTAVGRGGTNGFVTGVIVGVIYVALGYGLCAVRESADMNGMMLTVEFLMGALLGGVSGALTANLPAKSPRSRKRTA